MGMGDLCCREMFADQLEMPMCGWNEAINDVMKPEQFILKWEESERKREKKSNTRRKAFRECEYHDNDK